MGWLLDVCALRKLGPWCLLLLAFTSALTAKGQEVPQSQALVPITIARTAGHEDGEARLVEKDKNGKTKIRKVAPHAVSAWRVRGPYGALVVVVQPARG